MKDELQGMECRREAKLLQWQEGLKSVRVPEMGRSWQS